MSFWEFKTFTKIFTIPSKKVFVKDDSEENIRSLFKEVIFSGDFTEGQLKTVYDTVLLTEYDYSDTALYLTSWSDLGDSYANAGLLHVYTGNCTYNDLKYVLLHELRHVQQFDRRDLEQRGFELLYKGQCVTSHPIPNIQHVRRPQELDANTYALSFFETTEFYNSGIVDIVTKTLEYQEELRNKAA